MQKKDFFRKAWLCLLWLVPAVAAAQKISVQYPSTVDINESYFQIRYTIPSGDVSDFKGPDFSHFDLLSGPNVSRSYSSVSINGKRTSESSTTYTYTLAPREKGRFRLAAASATVGGRRISAQPLTISVDGTAGRRQEPRAGVGRESEPPQPQTRGRIGRQDLFVSASASRKSVYNGESVLLSYDIYFRPGVALHNVGLSRKPDFKNVVAQDIPIREIQRRVVKHGGQTYEAGTICKTVIFPQADGKVTIPSLEFDCVVAQPNLMLDLMDAFFNSGDVSAVQLKRAAEPVEIEVKPLPKPAPEGFLEAVGRFGIKGELLKGDYATNEFCTYRITVSGNGNLNMLSAPSVEFPADFDTFDPKSEVDTKVSADGLEGKVVFDYVFVPKNVGHYEIPAVKFAYFDPQAGTYRVQTLPAVPLDIRQGKRTNADVEREMALRTGDIRDIHSRASEGRQYDGVSLILAYLLLVAAGIVTFAGVRKWRSRGGFGRKDGGRNRRLRQAERLLGEPGFYEALSAALRLAVGAKCGVTAESVGAGNAAELLERHGVAPEWGRAAAELLEGCDFARFAGVAAAPDGCEMLEKAKELMKRI